MMTQTSHQIQSGEIWGPYSSGGTESGWLQSAIRLASPYFGNRPLHAPATTINIDLLVLHSISLPPGQYGTGAVQQLFTGQLDWNAHPYYESIRGLEVSTHFFIDRAGVVWQFVDCDLRAWHAGVSHYRGRSQCNDDSIGIELEGLEGCTFESIQYQRLIALCHTIFLRYPIAYIAGHQHIAPDRKNDPGSGFDWTDFQNRLQRPDISFPNECTT